ncbi:NAD(P)-binding protein [Cryphonectria parasitica EP155]|uniref:NAD(P)-binding protein n=1 Tax=Cryphonectria parasitica (strain ATCC 38755 / EP155) TaxID=660469 RepID=A0A9P4Y6H2_CRYP1|nr:NAD(P)-binding protein [Cryphonectria parasitica EP155]KAF3767812.1 NAD(P)-binding protein [Cryphonectria parasitica EP155]
MVTTPTKSALITGCSEGGIGHHLALEFQRRGNIHVFATARSLAKMEPLAGLPNVTLLALDVTSQASIDTAAAAVAAHTGGTLDYLVNNAGLQYVMPVLDLDNALARRLFDVNFWGVFSVTRALAPLVIAAKGTIANLSSIGTLLSLPYLVTYASSKAAAEAFSEGLRRELAPLGVKVATVMVGGVKTNIHSSHPALSLPEDSFYRPVANRIADRAAGRDAEQYLGPPEDFARGLVDDLLRGASGKVYHGKMASMAGIARLLPSWLLVSRWIRFPV